MISALFVLILQAPAHASDSYFKGVCDASAAVAIGSTHLLVAEDENDALLLYATGNPTAVKTFDFSSLLRIDIDRESDIEGAARIGNRIYWITSHGRNGKGKIRANRYQLFATDISNSQPTTLELDWVGSYRKLIDDVLNIHSWESPDSNVTTVAISLLREATLLHDKKEKQLAPKKDGLNIEALAALPSHQGLLIGLRNPLFQNRALVLHLKNPDLLFAGNGAKARFGEPRFIDLDGLGLRSMAYHPATKKLLIIAGGKKSGGSFKLFEWDYHKNTPPVLIWTLPSTQGSNPEGLVIKGSQIHVLHDEGSRLIQGKPCKENNRQDRQFSMHAYHLK